MINGRTGCLSGGQGAKMKVNRCHLLMQAEDTPATGHTSSPNVIEAADTENYQPQEPWLLPHVRFCIASVLTVRSPEDCLGHPDHYDDVRHDACCLWDEPEAAASGAGAALPEVRMSEDVTLQGAHCGAQLPAVASRILASRMAAPAQQAQQLYSGRLGVLPSIVVRAVAQQCAPQTQQV